MILHILREGMVVPIMCILEEVPLPVLLYLGLLVKSCVCKLDRLACLLSVMHAHEHRHSVVAVRVGEVAENSSP